ncbi:MAG: hypothetical protein ABI321_18090 [Polyangia bacterium]
MHDPAAFVKHLAKDTPEATATHLYGEAAPRVLARLRSFGPGFDRLAYHPGLVTRMSEFKRFLDQHGLRNAKPEDALAAFSRSLGTRTVYRALALDAAGAARIKVRGIESALSQHDMDLGIIWPKPTFDGMTPTHERGDDGFGLPVARSISNRLTGWGGMTDPLLSVAADRDVAIAATAPFATDGKQIHVYQLRVPAIDMFHMGKKGSVLPRNQDRQWLVLDHPDGHVVKVPFPAADTESFMLYRIDPKEIVGHTIADRTKAATYSFEAR